MYRWSVIGCHCSDTSLSTALLELEHAGWEIFCILHDVDPRKAREDMYRIVSRRPMSPVVAVIETTRKASKK